MTITKQTYKSAILAENTTRGISSYRERKEGSHASHAVPSVATQLICREKWIKIASIAFLSALGLAAAFLERRYVSTINTAKN